MQNVVFMVFPFYYYLFTKSDKPFVQKLSAIISPFFSIKEWILIDFGCWEGGGVSTKFTEKFTFLIVIKIQEI